MKKAMWASYFSGITDTTTGESYTTILRYFFPELITAFLLYSLPCLIDAVFISKLASTSAYATLGATNNFIHFIVKLAEAISVGTVIITGRFNGLEENDSVGKTVRDSFWVTVVVGFVISAFLYYNSFYIYRWYGVPAEVAQLGVPFLRLRAIGVFFTFLYFGLIGFLRGVKNTKVPMITFVLGSILFVLCDYLFIFGHYGFPKLGLLGSALASVIQYFAMFCMVLWYVFNNPAYRKYSIHIFSSITHWTYVKQLLQLSWPIMIDKATMAWSYIWLCKMINPMGTNAIASFCIVKDLERFIFLPAIACAQVITLLVSNDFGKQNWEGIKSNLKKICFIASIMVFSIMIIFLYNSEWIIRFFDKNGEFTPMAKAAFPILSVLVWFDLVQLILSGTLRGAGNVRVVMFVRLLICVGYFVPFSYLLSQMHIQDTTLKFILIYGSFYVGNLLMNIVYISRLRGEEWKASSIKGTV